MGRGRGKGKKNTFIAGHSEEDKLLVSSKRRGRPQKPLKDELEEDEEQEQGEKIESDENASSKDSAEQSSLAIDKGRKRKKAIQVKENSDPDPIDEVNDSNGDVIKSVGFRPVGSRRKNKPCRAAEVGVKCK